MYICVVLWLFPSGKPLKVQLLSQNTFLRLWLPTSTFINHIFAWVTSAWGNLTHLLLTFSIFRDFAVFCFLSSYLWIWGVLSEHKMYSHKFYFYYITKPIIRFLLFKLNISLRETLKSSEGALCCLGLMSVEKNLLNVPCPITWALLLSM